MTNGDICAIVNLRSAETEVIKMINTAKIKGRLRELGKTQAELAEYVGIAQSTINQKLNGDRPLFLDESERFAEFLGISDAEFCKYFFNRDSA